MCSVAKDAALAMITGLHQAELFTRRHDFLEGRREPLLVYAPDEAGSRISVNQLLQAAHPIARNIGKDFVRQCADLSAGSSGQPVIEDSRFVRAGDVALQQYR